MRSAQHLFVLLALLAGLAFAPRPSRAANTEAQWAVGAENVVLDESVSLAQLPQLDCLMDMTEYVNDILSGGRETPLRFQLDVLFLLQTEVVKGAPFKTVSRIRILNAAGAVTRELELDNRTRRQGKKVTKRWFLEWDPRSAGLEGPLGEGERVLFESYSQGLKQKLSDRASHFCNAG